MLVTLYLSHGFTVRSTVAMLGTLVSLVVIGGARVGVHRGRPLHRARRRGQPVHLRHRRAGRPPRPAARRPRHRCPRRPRRRHRHPDVGGVGARRRRPRRQHALALRPRDAHRALARRVHRQHPRAGLRRRDAAADAGLLRARRCPSGSRSARRSSRRRSCAGSSAGSASSPRSRSPRRSRRWSPGRLVRERTDAAPGPPTAPRLPRVHQPTRLVVLVSGSGTNLQALLDACADPSYGARVVAVGADRDDIEGLARAERAGIPTFVRQVSDFETREALGRRAGDGGRSASSPTSWCSAGFMKLLSTDVPRPVPHPQHPPGAVPGVPRDARPARRPRARRQGHRRDPLRGRRRASTPARSWRRCRSRSPRTTTSRRCTSGSRPPSARCSSTPSGRIAREGIAVEGRRVRIGAAAR